MAALAALVIARADMPLPPPHTHAVTSLNGNIRAVSDPDTGTHIEHVRDKRVLWRIPGFYWWLFAADDGKHLVTGYLGMNLIPTDYRDDLVLFTFWREGEKVEEVTLNEFIPDRRILQRTVSHYNWGTIEGIDARGRLKVQRADDKVFYFDLTSGKRIRVKGLTRR
ncbi:MAG: hypothetical protein H0U23_12460 [Blastocatellia bacterium]|nr:hypothetical protein [Blastocatellia bacterium]